MSSVSESRKPTLYAVTEEAANWRHLSDVVKKKELAAKVGLIALGIMILIAMSIGMKIIQNDLGYSYLTAVRINMRLGMLGIFSGGTAIVGGIAINFEAKRGVRENLDNVAIRQQLLYRLEHDTFTEFYNHYYRNNGGLTQLVQQGYLTVDQGNLLKHFFGWCHSDLQNIRGFERHNSLTRQAIEEDQKNETKNSILKSYYASKENVVVAQATWGEIQKTIHEQYASEPIPVVEPEKTQWEQWTHDALNSVDRLRAKWSSGDTSGNESL